MGQLHLIHLMSMQRRRHRRESQAPSSNGIVASRTKRKHSPFQQNGDFQADEKKMCLGQSLPEDIWLHILSLMPMQDAARAASVSRASLRTWRCHPTLTFTNDSLGLNKNVYRYDESVSASVFYSMVSHILAMHSGIGLKTLQIDAPYYSGEDSCCLNSWLQTALAPGIEELTFSLYPYPLKADYNFPYSFLSNGSGESIRYIHLACCSFHPSATLGSLRSLTRLHLCRVRITGEEVERLLCNSPALEQLEVRSCHEIARLKVPSVLQRLSYLEVHEGDRLRAIDNKAPNLSSFEFEGGRILVSLGGTLQIKRLTIRVLGSGAGFYPLTKFPSMMPNLEALTIHSMLEYVIPAQRRKFLHLRHLSIALHGWSSYPNEYLPLANFLDVAPSLETFHLDVALHRRSGPVSIFWDPSGLSEIQVYNQYHSLKNVTIKGFICDQSLVELTVHILESTTSLECLILEAAPRCMQRCSVKETCKMGQGAGAVLAIRNYIEPKVPSSVELRVLEPCSCRV